MPEVDFSSQIKAKNFSFAPKIQKLGEFKLSDSAKSFLEAKASAYNKESAKETSAEILASVVQNGFDVAKNFLRPGVSDLQMAIARLNRFLRYGDAKLLTSESVDILDVEYAVASASIAQNKLKETDFKASIEIEIEDEKECECEDEMETEEVDGKKVCAKCKKAKAKKDC